MADIEEQQPVIVIVSQMPGTGTTGVDTHIRTVRRLASSNGWDVVLVNPSGYRDAISIIARILLTVFRFLKLRGMQATIVRLLNRYIISSRFADCMATSCINRKVIVYAQDTLSSAICSQHLADDSTLITVVHFNNSELEEYQAKGLVKKNSWLERDIISCERTSFLASSKIIFVSDYMRRHVLSRFDANISDRCLVLFNTVEDEFVSSSFEPVADLISIGTLEYRKNQAFVIDVISAIRDLGYSYTLAIVGDGPDRTLLEKKVDELSLHGQVTFLGQVPNAQRLISEYRALIHGARIENLPITLIEALACGRPVFAIPVGGIPEVVQDTCEGCHLDADDVNASADRIVRALEDRHHYEQMCRNARVKYDTFFSQSEFWEKFQRSILER